MVETGIQSQELLEHLSSGTTSTCRCWLVERSDGWRRGFTDHDCDLLFDGVSFSASTGFTAGALEMTTGLSVNNTETIGAISDAAITEEDIESGRFDGASITCWIVNWNNPDERVIRFKGSVGEIRRDDDTFTAELLGQTDKLNQPQGRAYQRECSALLGDDKCSFDVTVAGFFVELPIVEVADSRVFRLDCADEFDEGWFERGRLKLMSGTGQGLWSWIKNDLVLNGLREITIWHSLRADIRVGDTVRLEAGCDKSASTCATKFGNFYNFRGSPHIPGEDWLTSYPRSGEDYGGGSMNAAIVS